VPGIGSVIRYKRADREGVVVPPGRIPVPPGCRACKARAAGAAPRSTYGCLRRRPSMSGVMGT